MKKFTIILEVLTKSEAETREDITEDLERFCNETNLIIEYLEVEEQKT